MNTKVIIIILSVFSTTAVAIFIVSQFVAVNFIEPPTFQVIGNLLALGVMLQSAAFNFLIIKQSNAHRKNSDDSNERAEAFRNLQFIASNHTIIDFVDNLLIFQTSSRYIKRLRENLDFKFYLRERNTSLDDIKTNFKNYQFLTVKIPIKVVVGSAVSMIQILNFSLKKEDSTHNFMPCSGDFKALLLYNETDERQEISVNLIVPKDSELYSDKSVDVFTKIRLHIKMHSFLGVAVTGWTELYFSNPQKLEKDGASKYKIHSSQFQIVGLPELENSVGTDISEQVSK